VLIPQYHFLFGLDGKTTWFEKRYIKKQSKIAESIRNKTFDTSATTGQILAYWPGKWWKNNEDYEPISVLKDLDCKVLILQGSEDYQVDPIGDFEPFQKHLAGKDNVETKLYPGLNHLFMKSKREEGPSAYFKPNNLPIYVIKDISEWAKK